MKAYLSQSGDNLARALDDCESVTAVISAAVLEARVPGISPTSRQAYYQLAMTCKGTALGIVRAVERNNGVEAWRRLCQRYQPDAGPRMQQMMTRILTPGDFPDSVGGFEAALVAWEGLIEKWESVGADFPQNGKLGRKLDIMLWFMMDVFEICTFNKERDSDRTQI